MPRPAAVAAGAAFLLVAAGAEGLVAGAGQHDDADVAVGPRGAERGHHLVDGLGAEGVAHLRPVDRDPRDAVARVVENVLERHG